MRVTPSNHARYFDNRDRDYVDGAGTVFAVNHPGVIIAVHEFFGEKVHLWAEELPELLPGNGCATIWDVTAPDIQD